MSKVSKELFIKGENCAMRRANEFNDCIITMHRERENKNSLIIKLCNHFIAPIKVIEHGSV